MNRTPDNQYEYELAELGGLPAVDIPALRRKLLRSTHAYRPPYGHRILVCDCGAERPQDCEKSDNAISWPNAEAIKSNALTVKLSRSTHLDSGDHSVNDAAIIARLEDDMVSNAGEPNIRFMPRRPLPSFGEMMFWSGCLVIGTVLIIASAFLIQLGGQP